MIRSIPALANRRSGRRPERPRRRAVSGPVLLAAVVAASGCGTPPGWPAAAAGGGAGPPRDPPVQDVPRQDPPSRDPPSQDPPGARQGEPVARGNEVIVTAERWQEPTLQVPRATNVVDLEAIRDRLPQTTPDALREEVGIVVQKTNQGGGSPIIRGRTGKSVLLLIDGQRFNDATFRRNTQYLNTLDLNAIERLEVVRGPSSVLYGSDAMGGAINVITRRRRPTGVNAVDGRFLAQFETANLGLMGHLGINAEVDGSGVTAGYTYKDFDHLRAGSHGDPIGAVDIDGVQDPTAYQEQDFSFSVTRQLSETSTLDFLYLFSRQDDVPRSDRLIANDKQPTPPDLVREFDPQVLRWYELRYGYESPEDVLEGLQVTATFNNPEEERRRVRSSDPNTTILESDESFIPGATAQATLAVAEDHRLTAGIEAYHQEVDSGRRTVDGMGNETVSPDGRYPDGSTYQTFGIYAQDQWQLSDDVRWTNGLRYSVNRVEFDLRGLTVGPLGPFGELEETYDDVTFSTSLSVKVGEDTWAYGSFGKGFRAPNLDDLAVLGDFSSGERVPNLAVDPETVYSPEIGVKHGSSRLRAEGALAVAFYEDLLDNTFAFNDGTSDFFQIDNVGRATIYTVEGLVSWVAVESDGFSPEQSVYATAFANYGENETADEPVSKIPPPQGDLGYRVDAVDGRWFGEAFLRGALEQDRLSSADRADPRFPIGGTPAWWTLNLRGAYRIGEGLRVGLWLNNLFDQRYRVHGSGIDAPGFNLVMQLELLF